MKSILTTGKAPAPIGPYNQAVSFGNILFVSGQIAMNPDTGELEVDNIEDETHRVLINIGAILNEAGLDYEHVLKASVFVKDMHAFGRINAVYAQYFKEDTAPARELVEVSNLPKFVNVEISVIAGI